MVTRKSRAEIERMRRAGRIVAEVLALVEDELKPGVTTGHLDRIAEAHIRKAGAIPSFKGYPGINPRRPFPGSLCISIDDEIVHGIPGERAIRDGQVVSIDAGAIVEGWHGDAARTFFVGEPPAEVRQLIDTTRAAMMAGIAAAVPGNHIEDISAAVEDAARPHGFGVIRQFVGHGIGTSMHEDPQVPTTAPVAAAASWSPAYASPSSRCSRSATTGPTSSRTTGPCRPSTAHSQPISRTRSPLRREDPRSSQRSDEADARNTGLRHPHRGHSSEVS